MTKTTILLLCLVVAAALIPVERAAAQSTFTPHSSGFGGDTVEGIVWYPPVQLSPDSDVYPWWSSVATLDDTVCITWCGSRFNFPFRRSTDGGRTFEPLREISTPDSLAHTSMCFLVSSGKRLHAFFRPQVDSAHPYTGAMYTMHSEDAGENWSPVIVIQQNMSLGSFGVHGDTVVIMNNATDNPIISTTDGGETWTKSTSRPHGNAPYITFANGSVHLVKNTGYQIPGLPEFVIQYLRSTDFGNTWTDSLLLNTEEPGSDLPCIAADPDASPATLISVWRDGKYGCMTDLGCSQVGRLSFDNGTTWQAQRRFDVVPAGFDAVARVQDSAIAIVWNQEFYYFVPAPPAITVSSDHGVSWTIPYAPVQSDTSAYARPAPIALSSGVVHTVFRITTGLNETSRDYVFYRRGVILSAQRAGFALAPEDSLHFDGEIVVSCHSTRSVTVRNTGKATLVISSVQSTDSSFTVSPIGASIQPKDSLRFAVTFSPTSAGEKSGSIIFTHNAPGTSPDTLTVTGTATGENAEVAITASYGSSSGWQLVSLPVGVVACPYVATSSLYAYTSGSGYTRKDTMELGTGYWQKLKSPILRFVGDSITADTIELATGWNLIGSISAAVPVGAILTVPSNIITSPFYGYQRKYIEADTVQPGHAYWVKARQDGKLILSRATN